MGDQRSRRKPTITGTHPNTKQPPPTSLPTPAPRAGKLPQSRTRLSRLAASLPPAHAHTRETLVVLKLRQKATFIFCIISAHPLTLKWGVVWVHTHPRADQFRGILAPDSARSERTKVLHTQRQPMALVRDRAAVAVFLTLLPDATSS